MNLEGDNLTGTSNYITEITGAGGEGNYLVIELPQAKDEGNTVKCKFEGGEEITLSTTDYQYLIKLTEGGKKPITVTVTGKVNDTRTIDISGVTLSPKD